ncbi:MAG: prepilin-type N-terminal cleavage/methylation domain-containing protein [Pirellulales bacterium]
MRRSRSARRPCKKVPDTFLGFSLLEVILALAILAGALAALGEVMRLGDENAAAAADESRAAMLAESVMSELLVGARPIANLSGAVLPLDDDPAWAASIEVAATPYQELVAVRVSIVQQLAPEQRPARCDLVRWMPNPNYIPASQQQQSSTSSSSSSASGSNTSGSGGNSGTP